MNRTAMAIVAVVGVVGVVIGFTPVAKAEATPAPSSVSLSDVKKADQTIAEIYAGKDSLLGTVVNVRGKVVKFSAQIMGKNWAHVQDGTGSTGTNDLTVTTADAAKVGDTVLVSGKITLNKDFGAGYKYALIIEDGKVLVEP